MNKRKLEKLKAAGWKVGNAEDFLGLSKEETALVEIKVALLRAFAAVANRPRYA